MAKNERDITWKDMEIGLIITEPGNAVQYKTGDWKSQSPILDESGCNKCGLCYIFCPEGCIKQKTDGYFEIDLSYCKGCGICDIECPKKVITMMVEEE